MNKKKFDIYQTITDKFIASLEKGHIPWKKSHTGNGGLHNFKTKREYSGINVMLLGMNPYTFSGYATYKQISDMGGQVKKGEKGSMVVYWNMFEKKDKITKEVIGVIPFLKYFTVFNMEQTEGIDYKSSSAISEPVKDIECAEAIINNTNTPEVQYVGGTPRYIPSTDEVKVPLKENFISIEERYNTIFHELAHSTGHVSRLNRKGITETSIMKNASYSYEELIAEISASFLSEHCGFGSEVQDNNEAYVKSWIKKLSDDPKMIVSASGKAVKAVNYILEKRSK